MPAGSKQRTRAVSHQYFIHSSPKKVFDAMTDPKQIVKWLADSAEIDLREGGQYKIGWKDGPQHSGMILQLIPGKSMTLSWEWEGVSLHDTKFKLSVESKGSGSLFQIEHSGFPAQNKWTDLYAGAEWGWTYFAMNLKSVLEDGHDLRSPYDG